MMDSLKQRIVDYVKANQPVKIANVIRVIGISRDRFYEEARVLRELDLLHSVRGYGLFFGEKAYQDWLVSGGREEMKKRAQEANAAAQEAKGLIEPEREDPKMFKPYNPECNGVVAEYMKSEAHQRLMMVYGRA